MNPNTRPRSLQRGSTLAGLMLGLLVGVVIAVAVAVLINFGSSPFKDTPEAPPPKPAATNSGPVSLPGKPGDKVGSPTPDKPAEKPAEAKPNFDFYKILPGGEAASAPPAADDTVIERIFVQAGAFNNPSDADNLKARLALMGMEASVQRVEIPDKGTLHRVRLGPYPRAQDAETVRATLAQEGIETSLVRSKPRAQGTQP